MRTISAAQANALANKARATHFRVKVSNDGGTTFVDLSNFAGHDWVDSFSYNGGVDVPIVKAKALIKRQADELTFAPFMTSRLNDGGALLDIANKIIVEVDVSGEDTQRPGESDWVEVFRGEIDTVDWANDPVVLDCRGQGHLLVDTFIKTQRVYGALDGSVEVEDVIQSLIDDNINIPELGGFSVGTPLTLYSENGTGGTPFNPADSPGWAIRPFYNSKESLHAALRRIALLPGYDVKYKYHENTSQFQLVFTCPVRATAAQGKLTLNEQPYPGETFVVNATTITARAKRRWIMVGDADGDDAYTLQSTNDVTFNETVNDRNIRFYSVAHDGKSQYVAVGDATGATSAKLATSPDGIAWTVRDTPKDRYLVGVAYSPSLDRWIATGGFESGDAYIVASDDNGETWQEQTNGAAVGLERVIWSATLGLFIAVGLSGSAGADALILTSTTGLSGSWTERINPSNVHLFDIADDGAGNLVAVGNSGSAGSDAYCVVSSDGISWAEKATPKDFFLRGIAYGDGVFVAGGGADGTDAFLISSADLGFTWTERSNPANEDINDIAFGDHLFMAVGTPDASDAYVISSVDGLTGWTEQENPKAFTLRGVTYAPAIATDQYTISSDEERTDQSNIVCVGDADGTDAYLVNSKNAEDFTERANRKNVTLLAVAYSPEEELFVATGGADGTAPYMLRGKNGKSWVEPDTIPAKNLRLNGVAYGNTTLFEGLWVAVGQADGVSNALIFGATARADVWTEKTNPKNFELWGVTFDTANQLFVAVGSADGTDPYLITSPSGGTWTEQAPTVSKNMDLYAVHSDGFFTTVAVGEGDGTDSYIITSADNVTWTERAPTVSRDVDLYAVHWFGNLWCAVGQSSGAGSCYCVTSADGITWTERTTPVDGTLFGVTYDEETAKWIAVGQNLSGDAIILTSDDAGVTDAWTEQTNPKAFDLNAIASRQQPALTLDRRNPTAADIARAVGDGTESANVFADYGGTQVLVEWATKGTAGNSIVFTEDMCDATADGSGTLGGTKAGVAGPTVVHEFDDEDYYNIGKLSVSKFNIRNDIDVTFQDPFNANNRVTVNRKDQASIDKYGDLYMGITEDGNSPVDTPEEAGDFANFALNDLSEPDANKSIPMRYFWPVEDSDYYRFKANGQHYDTDQDLAVVEYDHKLSPRASSTTLQVRGKPSGGVDRWLSLEGDNIRNPASDLKSDDPTVNVDVVPTIGGLIVTYDDPRTMEPPIEDWRTTECHVVAAADTVPWEGTKKAEGRQTRFEITQLIAGTTVWVKLVVVDTLGNKSTVSTQQAVVPTTVGPNTININTEIGNIVPNGDFGVTSLPSLETATPPDNWRPIKQDGAPLVFDDSMWGSNKEVYFESSAALVKTGDRSIRIDTSKGPNTLIAVGSENLFPVSGDQIYVVEFVWYQTDLALLPFMRFRGFEDDKTTETNKNSSIGAAPLVNTWYRAISVLRMDADTKWGNIEAGLVSGSGGILYVDRVRLYRAMPGFYAYRSGNQSVPSGGFTKVQFGDELHDYGNDFDETTNNQFVCPEDGEYSFSAAIELDSMDDTDSAVASIYIENAEAQRGNRSINGTGGVSDLNTTVSIDSVSLLEGDTVDVRIFHDNGSNKNVTGNSILSYFTGRQIK